MYTAAVAFGAVIVVLVEAGERYCCCRAAVHANATAGSVFSTVQANATAGYIVYKAFFKFIYYFLGLEDS